MQNKQNIGTALLGCLAIAVLALPLAASAAQLGSADGKALPMPEAPTGKAPIGTMVNRMLTCVKVQAGGEQRFGSVDSMWEYRFMRDTDADGMADAAPAWSLSSVSVYFYPAEDAAACK
jgi:hypothetical protein